MIRNKAIRLLTLLGSVLTLSPLIAAPAFIPGVPPILGFFAGFMIWGWLTVGIGNCFIALWGTPQQGEQRS